MAKEKIETYPEAARVIHLWLAEFCDENRPYPDMIAEASRRASKEIDRLRNLTKQTNGREKSDTERCNKCHLLFPHHLEGCPHG